MGGKFTLKIAILLGATLSFLCGCTSNYQSGSYNLKYGSFCSLTKQERLARKLRHQGIQINYFGDYIYVIIPSRILFRQQSATLKAVAPYALNLVAEFLRCYQKITVHVVGFASRQNSNGNVYLAHKQAQIMAKNLWRRQVDARLMHSSGEKTTPAMDKMGWGNRIEVITKRLP